MNYKDLSEDQLLEIMKEDSYAMEELLSRYKNLVRQIARSYFLIGAEPDDLLQEGMIGLYGAILSYKPEFGAFKGFACVCIKRRLLTAVKSANRQKNKILNESISLTTQGGVKSEDDENVFIIPSDDLSPVDELIARENYEGLQQFINKQLSKFEKSVLKFYLDGLSYSEIAVKLETNAKSIENALARLRMKILQYK